MKKRERDEKVVCHLTAFDLSSPERFRRKFERTLGITPNIKTQADIAEMLRLIVKLAVPAPIAAERKP